MYDEAGSLALMKEGGGIKENGESPFYLSSFCFCCMLKREIVCLNMPACPL